MKLELANRLMDAADQLGIEANVYEDYSGRGMHGRTTAGLVIPRVIDIAVIAGRAIDTLHHEGGEGEVSTVLDALQGLNWDSLGREFIVY